MTRLGLVPYPAGDGPAPRSVPVSVVVLAKNEAANIGHCLASLVWADQVVVLDSGSTDSTPSIARQHCAEVVYEPWRGFGGQRQFALEMEVLRHPWIYFVDADEWVSSALAREVAAGIASADHAAFQHRLRLVFQGRWIRHCGWYRGSWAIRLMHRDSAHYGAERTFGERPTISGLIGTFANDIVDEDRKGLAAWLHKHVDYAVLEADLRGEDPGFRGRLRRWPMRRRDDPRSLSRALLKDLVFPAVPAKPLAMFVYMYVLRLGFLDGLVGLRFCLFHAWFQLTVGALRSRQVV